MKFYRVENDALEGPYINKCELHLIDWLIMEDVVDNYGYRFEEYMETRPSPHSRDRMIHNFLSSRKDREEYIFGFESMHQLNKWFCDPKEIEYFKHYKFHISVYETGFIYDSLYQAVANKNELKLVEQLTFS